MLRHRQVDTNGIRLHVAESGPGAGHRTQQERHEVNQALLEFLRSLPDAPGRAG